MRVVTANVVWVFLRDQRKTGRAFAAACALLAWLPGAQAGVLMEEGFPYPAGSSLAANLPWSGSADASLGVVSGNLTLGSFPGTTPAGNMLQIGGGTGLNVYRNFSSAPITGAPGMSIYCSMLINCTVLPTGTNSQFIANLMEPGATAPNAPDDPLDLFVIPASGGYRLSISRAGGDRASAGAVLTLGSTHIIVLKYTYGTNGVNSLYIDPAAASPEPAFANARTEQGDDGGIDTGSNLQVVLFHSPASPLGATAGSFTVDTLRFGTQWADVIPQIIPLSAAGPQDQSACSGGPVMFSVAAAGTPPFSYQWRTNGMAIADATNATFTLLSATPVDTANGYDVVVNDANGSVTSRVAKLVLSFIAPAITVPPADQPLMPGTSNATFSVSASGDPPLSFQWRTNGVPILGATNSSYTLNNPVPADGSNSFDVVVSNPCGAATSSPAWILFPHAFLACAALPGFFSGVNLITTNSGGLNLYAWSSPDPAQPITNWVLEGPLQEQPLNDGTGNSRYSINVSPVVSPVYYLLGQNTSPPYLQPVPVQWITTDVYGNNYFYSDVLSVNSAGVLGFAAPPAITQQPLTQAVLTGKTVSYSVTASGAGPLSYQWYFNTNSVLPGATGATLTLDAVTTANAGVYMVVVTNAYGSVTSDSATLTVLPAPRLSARPTPGGVQLNAAGVAGGTYWVQAATNLGPPTVWVTVATNVADASGVVRFSDTNLSAGGRRFYRLVSP